MGLGGRGLRRSAARAVSVRSDFNEGSQQRKAEGRVGVANPVAQSHNTRDYSGSSNNQGCLVQRLVAMLVLASLIWQQGACCCGDGTDNCWKDLVLATLGYHHASTSNEVGCCTHRHDKALSTTTQSDACHGGSSSSRTPPVNQEHHICLGSHVFFVVDHGNPEIDAHSTSHFYLPAVGLTAKSVEVRGCADRHRLVSRRASTPTLPLRSALQVFVV